MSEYGRVLDKLSRSVKSFVPSWRRRKCTERDGIEIEIFFFESSFVCVLFRGG